MASKPLLIFPLIIIILASTLHCSVLSLPHQPKDGARPVIYFKNVVPPRGLPHISIVISTRLKVKKGSIVLKSGDAGQVKTDVDAVYHAKARFGFKFTEFSAYYPARDRGHAAIYWRADNGGFDFSYDNKSNWKRGATWKYSDL